MRAFGPIERRKVYELLADDLRVRIGSGLLKPGDVVPTERELTESFRVGRSSVREALRILESQGLIESAAAGFVVADYGNPLNRSLGLILELRGADLRELFEVRKILEVETAALAAGRRTNADLADLASAIEEMEAGLESRDRYIDADLRFHVRIASATGNRIAAHMMHAVRDLLHAALASIFEIPGSPSTSVGQHRAIYRAIASADAEEARVRMREHLLKVEGDIKHSLAPMIDGREGG